MSALAPARTPWIISGSRVCDFLLGRGMEFGEESRPGKRVRDRTSYLSNLIYHGKHKFYYSARNDWYYPASAKEQMRGIGHAENYFGFLVRSNEKEYLQSFPVTRARAVDPEHPSAQDAARIADAVASDFERRHRPLHQRRVDMRRVQLDGSFAIFIDWDPQGGRRTKQPLWAPVEQPGQIVGVCAECRGEAAPDPEGEGARCLRCGSSDVQMIEVPPASYLAPAGEAMVPVGDWTVRSVPLLELDINSSARDTHELKDVLRLTWDYLQHRTEASEKYGDQAFASGDMGALDADEVSARYLRELQTVAGGTEVAHAAAATGSWANIVRITQEWYAPTAYSDYTASSAHEIFPGSGVQIERGQKLTELFPDGLRFTHSGPTPLKIEPKCIRKHWQFYGFDPNPTGFWPRGVEDAIGLQLDLNEVKSLIKTHTMARSFPTRIVRRQYLSDPNIAASPLRVFMAALHTPDTLPLEQLLVDKHPADLNQGAYALVEQYKEAMQYVMAALNNFNGADQAQKRTATESSILHAAAIAHAHSVIMGLAEGEARLKKLATALWQKNSEIPRTFEIHSEFSEPELAAFSGTDLDVEIDFAVEIGSELPRRPFQVRDDMEQYLKQQADYRQAFGEPMPDDLQLAVAGAYNQSALIVKAKAAGRVARRNLTFLQKYAESAEQIIPQMLYQKAQQLTTASAEAEEQGAQAGDVAAARVAGFAELQQQTVDPRGQAALILEWIETSPEAQGKVRVDADKHPEMRNWYEAYLQTDTGLNEPPVLVAMIEGRMAEHIRAEGLKRAKFTEAEILAQQPAMEMQAMQAAQAAMVAQGPDDDDGEKGPKKRNEQPRSTPTRAAGKEARAARRHGGAGREDNPKPAA